MKHHYRTVEQVKAKFGANPRRALVITTLLHESRAVRSQLVEMEMVSGSSGALYWIGRFSEPAGDWAVVHAVCQAGNSDASVVTTKAIGEFGGFDVVMFVGVAGSLKDDVPIGTVVAGNHVYSAHSGKEEDVGFQSRPLSYAAATELIYAANALIMDDSWLGLIKAPERTTLPPVDKYPCRYPPEAVIKAIASGEQVVAGSLGPQYAMIRQRLNDAAAVEMEGYGTMAAAHRENTSAIIVRGISDMCAGKGSETDVQLQPIAAAHAAAFAFGILSVRSKASPLSAIELNFPTLAPTPAKHESLPPQRVEYVVNFKGSVSDWSQDDIDRVVEGLRKVTGDPSLTLLRVDEGSVRLVISVREKDIVALTFEAIKAVAGRAGERLVGAVTAQDLSSAEEAKVALKRASANLLSWERTLPDGGWLDRPEQRGVEDRFRSESSSTVVLGDPGSGKSALLASIASDLISAGASVLAIKADFVSVNVHTEHDLQSDLGLSALPGELIERLARLQPVFLFIDQLDALASQLDLRSDRLNVLLNLVRRVGGLHNVHIVLSARTFEFNHDVRLRAIAAEAVSLALPAWHEVNSRLCAAGVNADTWPENAREVIRNPQALKTYLSLGKSSEDRPFSKYQSMLEQLWRQRIAIAPDSEALASFAAELAGTMAEEETLWLAASRFDRHTSVLERLESIGFVVRSDNGKSIAFSHQTVFEYVLARCFVLTAGRLSNYVLERQNSLFVRPKLWSALRYLRDAEITSYEREFLEIWREAGLRRHLRLLLIEFLGEQHEPVSFEEVCLLSILQSEDLRRAGLKSIVGSHGWFTIFARSEIPTAMAGNDIEANLALRILQRAWSYSTSEVIRLLHEQWLPTPAKDGFTWAALEVCGKWSKAIEEIAGTILARTTIRAMRVDYMASVLAVEQPEVAFRLVRAKLDFLLEKARAAAPEKPYPESGTHEDRVAWHTIDNPAKPFEAMLEDLEWQSLPAMAEGEPTKYLDALWPWFRTVFDDVRDRLRPDMSKLTFAGQYSIDVGLEGDGSAQAREHPLLASLRLAVQGAAKHETAYFTNWVKENSDLNLMAPQRLIAHGFTSAPETYAQQAVEWLFNDPRRLQLSGIHGARQTTAALVRTVSPYWNDEQVRDFETKIQHYRPDVPTRLTGPDSRRLFQQFIRTTKAHMLAVIPPDRLSEQSRKLVVTEKRALGENLEGETHQIGGGFIGSPMEAESMARAKDRDILKIFEEVPDNTDWDHPTRWMRGGNIQLSRAFATFAKTEPMRALRIMEFFGPRAQERAAGYALESMAEVSGHDRELQEALLDLHQRGFGSEEFRSSAASAVEKIAQRSGQVDEALVDMLTEWLAGQEGQSRSSDKTETPENIEKHEDDRSHDVRQNSILWGHGGASILPGGSFPILSALTSILLKDEPGRDRLLAIFNDHLPREKNPKVWEALLIRLSNAGGSTPEAVSTFLRALFQRFPKLLETGEAVHFLAFAQRWDDLLVHDLIAPWEHSAKPMLCQAQGELVGLFATAQGSERWTTMRDRLFDRGSPEAKIGMAYAGANLWTDTHLHAAACALLVRLLPGADKERMAAILDVFRVCDDLIPEPATLTFLGGLAAPEVDLSGASSYFIVERLQSILPHAADVIGVIALKLLKAWHADLRDIQTATAYAAPQLTDLAITLHRLGGASRETGVSMFEALIDLDAEGARDTLAEIDGRFGIPRTVAHQRISRRAPKRSSRRAA